MRVRDRRALPRKAACFRHGEIDVCRSAFVHVLAGPTASWERPRGENTSKTTCPDTKEDNNYHRNTYPSPHECQSERRSEANVLLTATRQQCSCMHRRRSSELVHRTCHDLPVATKTCSPLQVKGHGCLVPACQAVDSCVHM